MPGAAGRGQRCQNRGRVDPLVERPQGPTVRVYPTIRIGQSHHMALEVDNGIDGFGADQPIDRDLPRVGNPGTVLIQQILYLDDILGPIRPTYSDRS